MYKIVFDENIPYTIVQYFRSAGFDVLSIQETHQGKSDVAIIDIINVHGGFFVTRDTDFGEMLFFQQMYIENANIVLIRRYIEIGDVCDILKNIFAKLSSNTGFFVVMDYDTVRIKKI